MTNQDYVDWAFAQTLEPEQKLVLVALAMVAGPDGGGKINALRLSKMAATDGVASAVGMTIILQRTGLVIVHYAPSADDASAACDEISFGLCIDAGAKPT